jgi:gas vesicle protein
MAPVSLASKLLLLLIVKHTPAMNWNSNTKMIIGILAAAGIGFALGTLLAPQKGQDLRKNISDSLDDLGEKVSEMLAEGKKMAGLHGGNNSRSVTTGASMDPSKQAVS